MSKFKVAVFGDRMVDIYHIGEANGLSAEVPIPVVKIKEVKHFPGGAGNVVENLKALGCEVVDYTQQENIPTKTPYKHRLMVGDHQLARWDEFDVCEPYRGKVFQKVDAVVVADYGKGAVDKDTIEKIKLMDAPVFVDTKRDPSVWSGVATAVFPNEKEWSQFELSYASFDGLVVGKAGAEGLTLYKNGLGVVAESPAKARFVRSVNGAGDTVIAAFVYAYLEDLEFRKSIAGVTVNARADEIGIAWDYVLNFANTAAALAVENPYTYAPTLKEVKDRTIENHN